jgi:NADPH-dependent glutamate synthase beta subunit-like oxidoreductase
MANDTSMSRHVVAVIGGATAGSEVAYILAQRGSLVAVIEQNPRPYGKIEDGLPRWHTKQRKDEYERINSKLSHPNIEFLPLTRLGRDLAFDDLARHWGLSAVVLANGAWRDRRFPVEGAEQFVDRGLIYQNPLIYWFNHYVEKSYNGPRYEPVPGGIVVGGGLASIDVVKVLQIETTLRALARRGLQEEMLKLEREGIEPALKEHGLSWAELGIAPCKLYYRRRVLDMPLSDIPPDANPKRAETLRQARAKILDKAQRKFLFDFQELRAPTGLLEHDGRLVGLRFSKTEVIDGRAHVIPNGAEEVHGPFVVSSIGSIPERIPDIPQQGEVYGYADPERGLLIDGPTAVFAAGNVLTGKGNIKDSLDSGTEIGIRVAESYLGLSEERLPLAQVERERAHQQAEKVAAALASRPTLPPDKVAQLHARFKERQRSAGYDGNYREWIARMTPPDLR